MGSIHDLGQDGGGGPIEVSARVGALIVHAAAAAGLAPERLREATGFDVSVAADPDARIPLGLETALWDTAARLLGDEAFGVHAAERLQPGAFDVLDYVVRTAPSARTAVERLARYNRLVHDVAVFRLVDDGEITRVEHSFRVGGVEPSRHAAEFTLASHVVLGAQITGTVMKPLAAELRHARPAAIDELVRVLGVEPRFGQPVNALVWARGVLDRPNRHADPGLSNVVVRHAEALLAALPPVTDSYADRVRRILARTLGAGEAPLAAVARQLKLSERSLQRRLAAEGFTFDALLDEVRHQLSLRYLADPGVSIAEIAYLLGYSEPSPFHRAFRRWTGATPSEVRRRAA